MATTMRFERSGGGGGCGGIHHSVCSLAFGWPSTNPPPSPPLSDPHPPPPPSQFYTSQKGDVGGEFAEMDVNRLAVTAMSGAVGECLTLGSARGIKGDLAVLEDVFRRSEKFIGEARRQDMTRWSGLTAYDILKSHEKEYEALKGVFGKEGTTVEDCVCCIEENRTRRDFEEDRA